MSSRLPCAVCLFLLFISTVDGEEINSEPNTRLRNRILDLIDLSIRYYLHAAQADKVDANLMLGVSIMKGQLMSCTDPYEHDFNRMHVLMKIINELYWMFYENKNYSVDSKTITVSRKMFDHNLWTSSSEIVRTSPGTSPTARGLFDADRVADDDLFYRNISDGCIFQAVTACRTTPECLVPELAADGVSGYALTHQVLYAHVLKKMKCVDPVIEIKVDEIIRNKCGLIYNEAMSIVNDAIALEKYKDLFIEQIAICGMQNMVEFIKPEWLSIVASVTHLDCYQHKNNDLNCDSHLTGVSLASLGVYWKFLCYKVNTYGAH
ncbi:UPF0764 protein C16orf89 homolog [Sipha flava]|uniref:UPF0764 protein C16orf89 homolog n=1 Tax=Sipha flava TaxID=143950 RepID=A0A2S2Q4A4_9HEMI|nr:UPF0764 protein C16orf89 homolog [Sipha flava]